MIHVQFLCHRVAHALPVPGEHDDLTDAFLLHFLQCPFGIGLYFIPDIKGTQIAASLCHIHGGGRIGSGRSRDPQFFHHTGISHGEDTAVPFRREATSGVVRDIAQLRKIGICDPFLRHPLTDGHGDGVGAHGFHRRCCRKQLTLVNTFRRTDLRDGEVPHGKGAGLVGHHRVQMGHQFQEVGSLHQNALGAGCSDPAEKGQGHGDDERAGTGDDEEGAGAVDPGGPGPREEGGDDGKDHGRDNDDGRIIPGKPGDEVLGVGFLFRCFLHHFQDFGDGGILKCLQSPYPEETVAVDASGNDLISGMDRAGHRFPGEGSRIDEALS